MGDKGERRRGRRGEKVEKYWVRGGGVQSQILPDGEKRVELKKNPKPTEEDATTMTEKRDLSAQGVVTLVHLRRESERTDPMQRGSRADGDTKGGESRRFL